MTKLYDLDECTVILFSINGEYIKTKLIEEMARQRKKWGKRVAKNWEDLILARIINKNEKKIFLLMSRLFILKI